VSSISLLLKQQEEGRWCQAWKISFLLYAYLPPAERQDRRGTHRLSESSGLGFFAPGEEFLDRLLQILAGKVDVPNNPILIDQEGGRNVDDSIKADGFIGLGFRT
jgi:hypothetical protein